ncbi:hypothetical protein BJ912DRAFT_943519 [Pholiota molesta]|nr:hypothetical protein BJ912DRAFT_943519 [Pholiota molesta]
MAIIFCRKEGTVWHYPAIVDIVNTHFICSTIVRPVVFRVAIDVHVGVICEGLGIVLGACSSFWVHAWSRRICRATRTMNHT